MSEEPMDFDCDTSVDGESDGDSAYESVETCILDATRAMYPPTSLEFALLTVPPDDPHNCVGALVPRLSSEDVRRVVRVFRGFLDINVVGVEGRSAIWLRDLVDQTCEMLGNQAFSADDVVHMVENFANTGVEFTLTMARLKTNGFRLDFELFLGDTQEWAACERRVVQEKLHNLLYSCQRRVSPMGSGRLLYRPPDVVFFCYKGGLWAARREDVTPQHIHALDFLSVQKGVELSMLPPNRLLVDKIEHLMESVLGIPNPTSYICPQLPPLCTVPVQIRLPALIDATFVFLDE